MYLYTFRRRDISFSIVQMKQKQTYSMTASTTFINKNFQKEKGYMTYDLFLACSQKHNMWNYHYGLDKISLHWA